MAGFYPSRTSSPLRPQAEVSKPGVNTPKALLEVCLPSDTAPTPAVQRLWLGSPLTPSQIKGRRCGCGTRSCNGTALPEHGKHFKRMFLLRAMENPLTQGVHRSPNFPSSKSLCCKDRDLRAQFNDKHGFKCLRLKNLQNNKPSSFP